MTWDKVAVNLAGLGLIVLVVWFFFFSRRTGTQAAVTGAGVQEALILVRGGYTPDLIVVKAGQPVRLKFNRQEASPCSERVVLAAFNQSALLPEGETVSLEFTPPAPGEYEFACQMGMFRGKVVAR